MVKKVEHFPVSLMLDSGAFSAWARGQSIDVDKYIAFIKEHEEFVASYVNVDVIPGVSNMKGPMPLPTRAEVEASAKAGWDNMKKIEDAGLKAIPVFHLGENFSWLDKMLEHGYDYIGLGFTSVRNTAPRIQWLDRVFTRLTNKDGWPIVKTHAFGLTSVNLMFRYPWYSCDSVTWMLVGGYGGVYIAKQGKDGEPNFGIGPRMLKISDEARELSKYTHYNNVGPVTQAYVQKYLNVIDIDLEKLRVSNIERNTANLRFFRKIEENLKDFPFEHRKAAGLFGE